MVRWLSDLLWGSPPVEFESPFDLAESIEKLRAATRRTVFSALSRQEAVGTVKQSRVSLQRVIPMVGNSFKPFYRGHFIERSGKVVLVGRFTMHPFVKVFMAFWFSAAVVISIFGAIQARPGDLPFLFVPVAMIAGAAALVAFCRWLTRNDPAWLSEVIRSALSAPDTHPSTCADSAIPGRSRSAPSSTPMTVVAVVLVVLAAISWLGAIFGIQSVRTGSHGLSVAYFPNLVSRYLSAGIGTILLILAYGVYRRHLMAWRAGFGLIVGSWIVSIAQMFNNVLMPQDMAIVFSIASVIVTIIWIRWWHAQRFDFDG